MTPDQEQQETRNASLAAWATFAWFCAAAVLLEMRVNGALALVGACAAAWVTWEGVKAHNGW